MPRRVFFSFHFDNDFWRTQQVRNIGALEGQVYASKNEWEEVKRKGESSIKRWINDQMWGKSCVIVLVGEQTAHRKWVEYEVEKAWEDGKGLLGIRIHRLLDQDGRSSTAGPNPFENFELKSGRSLASVVPLHNPSGRTSRDVYRTIADNIESWIEDAIAIRGRS